MKKSLLAALIFVLLGVSFLILPKDVFAAGIAPTSGGSHTVGSSFAVDVVASGATFNAFQGSINVSGPVSVSVSPGNASWAPGGTPANHSQFEGGITSPSSYFTIATLSIRGTAVGNGSVSVTGVELVNNGSVVASGGGSTSFTIVRAPTPPGAITVTSSTNPDPTQTYGITTAQIAWTAPANGATGYSYVFDQTAATVPPETQNTTDTAASFPNLNLGAYYFHIRAVNGDGWGPTTNFQINIGHVLNNTLHLPVVSSVNKLNNFTESITTGTVSNIEIKGTGAGLAGYTLTLTFTPANLPTDQALTTTVDKTGNWQIDLTKAIPAGFYTVTAVATQGQTTTQTSKPVNVEFSVANGGTAKIVTSNDLPKPDLTVKKFGITFVSASQYHKALAWSAGIVIGFALICFAIYFLVRYLVQRFRTGNKHIKTKENVPSITPLKKL